MSAFGATAPTSFRLSGCIVTQNGTTYTTTAGYICLNGEVLKVDAHSVTIPFLHTAKWDLDVSYDISGNEQFFDTTSHDTYQIRRGKLFSTVSTIPITYMPYNARYLSDIITSMNPIEAAWQNVTGGIGFNANNPPYTDDPTYLARFKKDLSGWICLGGMIANGSIGSSIIAFTLPVGYRPALDMHFVVGTSGGSFYDTVKVCATGDV